jgi:GNAT superfamily N-acetyltransferase
MKKEHKKPYTVFPSKLKGWNPYTKENQPQELNFICEYKEFTIYKGHEKYIDGSGILYITFSENQDEVGYLSVVDGLISLLFISNRYRRNGLGTKLIQCALDENKYLVIKEGDICSYSKSKTKEPFLSREDLVQFYKQSGVKILKKIRK